VSTNTYVSSPKYHDRQWLREQYVERGRTATDIADECGVVYQTISRWCKKFGIDVESTGIDDDTESEIVRLIEDTSLPQTEIADRVGVSDATVTRVKQSNDVERHYDGHVYSSWDPRGYERIEYRYTGDRVAELRIHRLVAVAQKGHDLFDEKIVHHKNGIKWDNRPENLEVMTRAEHQRVERNATKS